jgi:hypothetical protein
MRRAIDEFQALSSASVYSSSSKSISFLTILDRGRKLLIDEAPDKCRKEGLMVSLWYHFLRLLHDFQNRCNEEGKYLLAKEFMEHELCLRKDEEARQIEVLTRKHGQDRERLAMDHEKQFGEYQECMYCAYS